MTKKTSEWQSLVTMIKTKPILVRSLAWAAIFIAVMSLAHPPWIYRSTAIVAVIAVSFGIAMAYLTDKSFLGRTIEANKFVLKDENGTVRGRLQVSSRGPEFSLFDANGRERVSLWVTEDIASLTFRDRTGAPIGWPQIELKVVKDEPSLIMMPKFRSSEVRMVLDVEERRVPPDLLGTSEELKEKFKDRVWHIPALRLYDEEGHIRASLVADGNETSLSLRGTNGKEQALLGVLDKDPTLNLYDESGKARAWLGLDEDGSGLTFLDADGKVLWKAP
jgi:hypothetical protein